MMHYLIFTYRHAAVYDFARAIDDNLEYIKAVEYRLKVQSILAVCTKVTVKKHAHSMPVSPIACSAA